MAQPYDVFIFLAAAVITMGVLYSTHLCCACSRKKSGDAPLQGLELTSTDDSSASVSGGQQATASATEQTKLSAGGPTTHTGSGKFTLFASQCWENNSIKTRVSHFGLRLACALAFSYVLTVIIVGILLGGAPAWVLYDPAPDSECVADCGSEQFCCSYNLFNDASLNSTRVTIPSEFGPLDGFLMRNINSSSSQPPLTILYSHGSGWNVAVQYRVVRYAFLLSLGNVQVLTYDYAGYGASPGDVNEENVKKSSQAALSWLGSELGVQPSNVTLLGRSLGGAVTASLVKHVHSMGDSVHSVVVESSWDYFSNVVAAFFPMTAFIPQSAYGDWWASADDIEPLSACYLQFHSEGDEQVPQSAAEGLFDAVTGAPKSCKVWVSADEPKHDDPMPAVEKDALKMWFDSNRL